ncbi:MAG: hypothetical protein P1S60_11600, partial [Anaerolineae bacterium]|nr:hypothetical protein [Anaerolineae bacterium]
MPENTWEQFTEACQKGYEKTQQELKEIDMLIQQTSSEVERFMQANSRAVARARQIESQFDTVPRDDIQKSFNRLIENQQRLFTMRGQLEKLQSDQKNLTRMSELYQKVLQYTSPTLVDKLTQPQENAANASQAIVIRIIEAQEQERLRLSRQMHDGP